MTHFTKSCLWCNISFDTEWETKDYCSRAHKEQASRYRKRLRENRTHQVITKQCIGCGVNFTTWSTTKTYCSPDCRQWVRTQMKNERDRAYLNAKSPALKNRLYWRDKGICQICQQPIDTDLKYPDPKSFSIDHIVPRSVKPDHTFENLRSTHLRCNLRRGNTPA
jgi:hypothetical protein